jgi:hypothetical protein
VWPLRNGSSPRPWGCGSGRSFWRGSACAPPVRVPFWSGCVWLCRRQGRPGSSAATGPDATRRIAGSRFSAICRRSDASRSTPPGGRCSTRPRATWLYGNEQSTHDPDHYLALNPYHDLADSGAAQRPDTATTGRRGFAPRCSPGRSC